MHCVSVIHILRYCICVCSLPLCCIISCFLVSSCCPVRVRWRWVEIDLELMKPTVLFGRFGMVRVSPACWQTDCPVTNLIKQGPTVTQCSQRPPSAQAADQKARNYTTERQWTHTNTIPQNMNHTDTMHEHRVKINGRRLWDTSCNTCV